ncbi:MAG: hypothetical protein K6T85_07015 [Gorillibacterium sp.]|nr:hypothetical protein [Gorillibacterium sp.]
MIKYYASQQADPGTYSLPLLLSNEELLLNSIWVPGHESTDKLTIEVSVSWEKPGYSDIGQLDLLLRAGGVEGVILADSEATCFAATTSRLTYSGLCHEGPSLLFVLLGRSIDSRALITGPLSVEVSISS